MPQPASFTLSSDGGKLRELKTKCGVCPAFDPSKGGKHPKVSEYIGLWDTGASGTVISHRVVASLDLKPVGKSKVFHADGESVVNNYLINLFLPNKVAFQSIRVTEGVLNGFDLLIGMDIITTGDFSITNVGGNTTFSFRVPSIEKVDFVDNPQKIKPHVNPSPKLGRNDPCHCGSGKKYKVCHGRPKPS